MDPQQFSAFQKATIKGQFKTFLNICNANNLNTFSESERNNLMLWFSELLQRSVGPTAKHTPRAQASFSKHYDQLVDLFNVLPLWSAFGTMRAVEAFAYAAQTLGTPPRTNEIASRAVVLLYTQSDGKERKLQHVQDMQWLFSHAQGNPIMAPIIETYLSVFDENSVVAFSQHNPKMAALVVPFITFDIQPHNWQHLSADILQAAEERASFLQKKRLMEALTNNTRSQARKI